MTTSAQDAPGESAVKSPRAQLRAATQPQHTHLEALLRLGEPDLSLAQYSAVLQRFYPIYAQLEAALWVLRAPLAAEGWEWSQRRKLPRLAADLQALQLPIPVRSVVFSLGSVEAAWGCLYVVEGATLGGQFIVRAVRRLGLTPEYGAAFFAGYGSATGSHWRAFCAGLDAALAAPAACAEAIRAARQTFDLFASEEGASHEVSR